MEDREIIKHLESELSRYAEEKGLRLKQTEEGEKLNDFELFKRGGWKTLFKKELFLTVSLPRDSLERETANIGDRIPHIYKEQKCRGLDVNLLRSRFRRFYEGQIISRDVHENYTRLKV